MGFLDWTWVRVFLVIGAYWIAVLAAGLVIARIRGRRQQPTYVGSDVVEYQGTLHIGRVVLVLLVPPYVVVMIRLILGY